MKLFKKITSKGAALVEYGILVGLIAVLAIVAVLSLGSTVRDTFNQVSDTLSISLASATAGVTVSGSGGSSAPSFVVAANAAAAWTFTAEAHSYNGGSIGADSTQGFGSLSSYPGSPTAIQTSSYPGSNYMAFGFSNSQVTATDFTGMTLDCDFGTFSSLPDANNTTPSAYYWALGAWSGHTMPTLVAGETYNCQIVP